MSIYVENKCSIASTLHYIATKWGFYCKTKHHSTKVDSKTEVVGVFFELGK